jgi:hypothetical protein
LTGGRYRCIETFFALRSGVEGSIPMDEPETAQSERDALLRVLLAALPRVQLNSGSPGMVAILRSDVVDAELDPLEVSVWVRDRGGHEGTAYITGASGPRMNGTIRAPLHPAPYFGVPAASLAAD